MIDYDSKIKALEAGLSHLHELHDEGKRIFDALDDCDFAPLDPSHPPNTDADMEAVACIANEFGFDGSEFRATFADRDSGWRRRVMKRLDAQLKSIQQIIAVVRREEAAQCKAIYRGNGWVVVPGREFPVIVDGQLRDLLEVLVKNRRASTQQIKDCLNNDVPVTRLIGKLLDLENNALEPFIIRPEKKGDGYRTTIVSQEELRSSVPETRHPDGSSDHCN